MPHLFRTPDGKLWKPSQPVSLVLADGTKIEAVWAGSATEEKLAWWLRNPGNELHKATKSLRSPLEQTTPKKRFGTLRQPEQD